MSINKCAVCSESPPKYKCPGCLVKTCSLPCVKQHKRTSGCSGQRNKTEFKAVKDFKDRDLLNDYRWLEEIGRKSDNACRDDLKRKRNKPGFVWKLTDEAKKWGINLKTLPYPMSKRKHNSTCYMSKTKCILWQVELIFVQAGAKFVAKRISEDTKLEDVLVPYIDPIQSDPVIRHRLKKYSSCNQRYHVLMKAEGRPASSVRYYKFDLDKTLKDNLHGKCVIEYPTLYVILSDHSGDYQLLEEEKEENEEKSQRMSSNTESQNSVTDAIMETSNHCIDEPQDILDNSNMPNLASDVLLKNSEDSLEDLQKMSDTTNSLPVNHTCI